MLQSFRLSRYCFYIESGAKRFFYHSLNFNNVAIGSDDNFSINDRLITVDVGSPMYYQLKNSGMIVENVKDDDRIIENLRIYVQEPYISTAYFFVTKNCNLACRYCFEKQSKIENSHDGVMSIETIEAGIGFFCKLIKQNSRRFNEKKTIIFYGGEPFHNKKILFHGINMVWSYINQGCLPENTKMIVVTNGTLLNKADIQFIKDRNVTITFSLDGDKNASVNRVYPDLKTLSWEKATETFIMCRQAGINLNVACTLTPETIRRKNETLDYLVNKIKANNIGFNLILDNDIIQLDHEYDDVAAKFVTSAYHTLKEHNITENRTQRRMQVYEKKHPCVFDCNAAGGRQIAVAPNGDVGICHEHIMDKKHFVTTIFDEFEPAKSPKYIEWQKRSPLYMEECQSCPVIGLCGGGCVINTERKFGTIQKPDPRFCKQTLAIFNDIIIKQF